MDKTEASPTFTVVIPTHNRPKLLQRAIRSVLRQKYDDFELIVVDDASTEDIESVVASFDDSRVRYIRREENGSAGATRNTGIRNARGPLVSFLDDDDEFLPGYLKQMADTMQNAGPDVGLAWCGTRFIKYGPSGKEQEQDGVWRPSFRNREEAHLEFLRNRYIGTNCGITIREEVFEQVGLFDERMTKAEDTDFLIRIVQHFDFAVVPQTLVKVHRHTGERLTTYDAAMATSYRLMAKKHDETLRHHPEIGATFLYKTAWMHYHSEQQEQARTYMMRSLKMDPLKIRRWVIFFLFELTGGGAQARAWHSKLSRWRKAIQKRYR